MTFQPRPAAISRHRVLTMLRVCVALLVPAALGGSGPASAAARVAGRVATPVAAGAAPAAPDLGPNVFVFDPSMR